MTPKQIKADLTARRKNVKHLTLKAIQIVIDCMESGDYSAAHGLKLYQYNGACYCELLEVLSENKKSPCQITTPGKDSEHNDSIKTPLPFNLTTAAA